MKNAYSISINMRGNTHYHFSTTAIGVGLMIANSVVSVGSYDFDELQLDKQFQNVQSASMCKQVRKPHKSKISA